MKEAEDKAWEYASGGYYVFSTDCFASREEKNPLLFFLAVSLVSYQLKKTETMKQNPPN